MKMKKRILSAFLATAILFGTLGTLGPSFVYATAETAGTCPNHTSHDETCGYGEAVEGKPCTHVHDEACGYTEGTPEVPCDKNCIDQDGDGQVDHAEDCSYMPAVPGTPCGHVHDETCGYVEAVEGKPCTHSCELCNPQENTSRIDVDPQQVDSDFLFEVYGEKADQVLKANAENGLRRAPRAVQNLSELVKSQAAVTIAGKDYTGGDVTVKEGDNFSFHFTWDLEQTVDIGTFESGDYFDIPVFSIPGVKVSAYQNMKLVISGIRVGTWSLTYDSAGVLRYKVVFNEYAKHFASHTIGGTFSGSGKFVLEGATEGDIILGGESGSGTITVTPRPETPPLPNLPAVGQGWSPTLPPTFGNDVFATGKGLKWYNSSDPSKAPNVEWRGVYLNYLQNAQDAFLQNGKEIPGASGGYCIIQDTVDANQIFKGSETDNKYAQSSGQAENERAPFFLEIPVMVPGTSKFLNAQGVGVNPNNYTTNGGFSTYITGEQFTFIDGAGDASVADAAVKRVKETPLSWTVTTDLETGKQTLTINLGKLGGTEPAEGVTLDMVSGDSGWGTSKNVLSKIENLTADCIQQLEKLEANSVSPVALLDTRMNALNQVLDAVDSLSDPAKKQARADFVNKYEGWRTGLKNGYGVQFSDPSAAQFDTSDLEQLKDLQVKGKPLSETQEYANFMTSYQNLYANQNLYMGNREQYKAYWENASSHYQNTYDFYEDGQIFGFVLKYNTMAINTSVEQLSNEFVVSLGNNRESASITANVKFSYAVKGTYQKGDVVLQKADAVFDTNNDVHDREEITEVENADAGLAGAVFQLYCKDAAGGAANLGHFRDKALSGDGSYYWTHTGPTAGSHVIVPGTETDLAVNDDGKLILRNMDLAHPHYLVEMKAPDGYYLDKTPIEIPQITGENVHMQMLPNITRAVCLQKVNSYNGHPVEGAVFQLTKEGGTPVTGFTQKTLKGRTFYWYDGKGTAELRTDSNGMLYIHGLPAGNFVLTESKPADGYLEPADGTTYTFALANEMTKEYQATLKEDGGFYYVEIGVPSGDGAKVVENDPKTSSVTLNKKNASDEVLPGAVFALLEWTGTEAEWDDVDLSKWKPVIPQNSDASDYFYTASTIKENVAVPDDQQYIIGKTASGITTDSDGALQISNLPTGHYLLIEVKAPAGGYEENDQHFHFDVTGKEGNEGAKLYRSAYGDEADAVEGNVVYNYLNPAQFALVKYDAAQTAPEITGEKMNDGADWNEKQDGWKYQNTQITGNNGLAGVTYKLFRQLGPTPQPNPGELGSNELGIVSEGYDPAIAVGTTGNDGVLQWYEMTYREGFPVVQKAGDLPGGVPLGKYYMVEVSAPSAYEMDQTPILFELDGRTVVSDLPQGETHYIPGLIKRVSNAAYQYGVQITKTDKDAEEDEENRLAKVGFTLTKQDETAPLSVTAVDLEEGIYRYDVGVHNLTEMFTGKNGTITILGLNPGTYTLTESSPLQGYKKMDPLTIMVAEGAKANTIVQNGQKYQLTDIEIENERLKGVVRLLKHDSDTLKPMQGAKFGLFYTEFVTLTEGDEGYVSPDDPDYYEGVNDRQRIYDTERTAVTGEDGMLTFDALEWRENYFLQELEAPDGYILNEMRYNFSVGPDSFAADGTPVDITINAVNAKGVRGEVVLKKTDAETGKALPGAYFYLHRIFLDSSGNEIKVPYGSAFYVSDENGEICLELPPGNYSFFELNPPPGYLVPTPEENSHYFTVPSVPVGQTPQAVTVTAENHKGGTGLLLKKTIEDTEFPIEGAVFRFYQGSSTEPLTFTKGAGSNIWNYDVDGEISEIPTDADGAIRLNFPADFAVDLQKPDTGKKIYYEEVEVPSGIILREGKFPVGNVWVDAGFTAYEGYLFAGVVNGTAVTNQLDEQNPYFSVKVVKTDDRNQPLEGAKFSLYRVVEDGEDQLLDTQVTGKDGIALFGIPDAVSQYYVVEVEAPKGFQLDETHHEIRIADAFGEDYALQPIEIPVKNVRNGGSVTLPKVDPDGVPLPGAEFEIFVQVENSKDVLEWEHYGEHRYVTDKDGIIRLDLPFGTYMFVERAAPLGFTLGTPEEIVFTMDSEHFEIALDEVVNRPEPGKTGSAELLKKDADSGQPLKGAKFQLYRMEADGEYHPLQENVYVTGTDGKIRAENLSPGNYAWVETEAPEGYVTDSETLWKFAVSVEGVVSPELLVVTNQKKDGSTTEPSEPEHPEQPTDPSAPSKPTEPAEPDKENPDTGTNSPQTGDNSNLWLWFALAFISGGAVLTLTVKNRTKRKPESK